MVKHGGVSRAAARLALTQSTISGQLRTFEDHLGVQPLERAGRELVLTERGRAVFRYADEIFSIGAELEEVLRGGLPEPEVVGREACLQYGVEPIGVADAVRESFWAITMDRRVANPAVGVRLGRFSLGALKESMCRPTSKAAPGRDTLGRC